MHLFKTAASAAVILTLASCQSIALSKKELAFAGQMSALLNGARVTLGKTATISTSEGSLKEYNIKIEGLSLDTPDPDIVLLGASSLPAYFFYEDTVADPNSYKYVAVTIKTKDKLYKSRYTSHQLQQVHESFITALRFINALKSLNGDLLSEYVDTTSANKFTPAPIIERMKSTDAKYGTIQKEVAKAFKFEEQKGRQLIFFRFSLHRRTAIEGADILVDPVANKVSAFNM